MSKVINGDTMKCIEVFDSSELDTIVKKYENLGTYEDVSVDCDGDIILYEEL